ncbi:MAG: long-chain fatty acid--CoA ligase [Treponema sp.]|nr:long-chain fatty acid--CoA ligase [Treponema sp.]
MAKFPFNPNIPKNVALLFKEKVEKNPDVNLQAAKNKEGVFQYYTYKQVYDTVINLAVAMRTIGIHRGSNVALISDNRAEWLWTDLSLLSLGAADVPRGCDSLGNEIRFIISFADCEVGFFENVKQLNKVLEKQEEVPLLKTAVIFEAFNESELAAKTSIKIINFNDLVEEGKKLVEANKDALKAEIEAEMAKTEPEEVATMIFTSGTTGTPKGVMLTHDNYISQLSCIDTFLPAKPGEFWLSVLPVWHVFERLIQYVAIYFSNGLAYSKPIGAIMLADMAVIKPQWMCGVPRLWEQLAKGVRKAMEKKGGITLKLFKFFLWVGKHYADNKDKVLGHVCRIKKRNKVLDCICGIIPMILLWPLHKLGDILVFSKLREKFGGRLAIAISGGGALQKENEDFYRSVGLNLLEGYGLSETAPVISFRYYKEPRPGCVGAIFPTFEVKIVKEEHGVVTDESPLPPGQKGLIWVRGRQVMKGYYKRPDLTEAAVNKDGWFNTGDLGIRTFDNELKITGRAKDTIVLLGGENIEPSMLEAGLAGSDYVESSMVVGQDQRYLGCLIVPNKEAVLKYAEDNKIAVTDYEALLETSEIQNLFVSEIARLISQANGFRMCERINKFVLIPNSFQVGVELSAKQEMMRYKISEKYAEKIATMF